jgi:hypothetical protein
VAVAWAKVEEDWNDADAHKRFVALCMSENRLADAGRLYRRVRDTDPARREEATRQIDQILSRALSTLEVLRTPKAPERNPKLLIVATVVFILLVGGATWAVLGAP